MALLATCGRAWYATSMAAMPSRRCGFVRASAWLEKGARACAGKKSGGLWARWKRKVVLSLVGIGRWDCSLGISKKGRWMLGVLD